MSTPQPGIFALGTASTAYLEFDADEPQAAHDLVRAIASLPEPKTTMGGVNLVVGFRPELWRGLAPADTPADAVGFNADIRGIGVVYYYAKHQELRLGQPLTITKTNLRVYANTF